WTLLAEYRLFDFAPDNQRLTANGPVCPTVYIPQKGDSMQICLTRGDIWDHQSGDIIHPDPSVQCVGYPNCQIDSAFALGSNATKLGRTVYPVGRYRYVDHNVKNGFLYFYSITAEDSTGQGQGKVELNGRRAAVEAEGISPQSAANAKNKVWVVPNPYRGAKKIEER